MTKLAATVFSIALLIGGAPALAQDDIASLQAKNVKLQTELSNVQARLRRAIAYSRENRTGLEKKLESATTSRDYSQARLRRAIAYSRENRTGLEKRLESATAGRSHFQDRLRRAIAYSRENRKKLESATAGRDQYRARLARSIEYNRAERGKLEKELNSTTVSRNHLREILLSTLKERDNLKKQLNSATTGRNHLREKLMSTLKKPDEWADNKSSRLNSSIGGLQGTQVVVNRDKSVIVRVGNDTGLFRTGGTRLSVNGSDLLSEIALELRQHADASMTVIGHTDNVPVGEGNRFASNQALSLARALSAVEFLQDQGISATQLSAAGYGADFPIADNASEEGRRINRRVEIELRAK